MRGRVIRRYKRRIPIQHFPKWEEQLRTSARGCGLYALYAGNKLVYVGLATGSIRARLKRHKKTKRFTHFSVFLVTGKTSESQKRRIRDLEALVLNVIRPGDNKVTTKFVGAKELEEL